MHSAGLCTRKRRGVGLGCCTAWQSYRLQAIQVHCCQVEAGLLYRAARSVCWCAETPALILVCWLSAASGWVV
jgi:hypothetical protein